MEGNDVPNGIILVLVMVAILVTVLGTWTILDASTSIPVKNIDRSESANSADLKMGIIDDHRASEGEGDLSLHIDRR